MKERASTPVSHFRISVLFLTDRTSTYIVQSLGSSVLFLHFYDFHFFGSIDKHKFFLTVCHIMLYMTNCMYIFFYLYLVRTAFQVVLNLFLYYVVVPVLRRLGIRQELLKIISVCNVEDDIQFEYRLCLQSSASPSSTRSWG